MWRDCEGSGCAHRVARRYRTSKDDVPLAEVANRLGYEWEAAFRRTFKRVVGLSGRQLFRGRTIQPGFQPPTIGRQHRRYRRAVY